MIKNKLGKFLAVLLSILLSGVFPAMQVLADSLQTDQLATGTPATVTIGTFTPGQSFTKDVIVYSNGSGGYTDGIIVKGTAPTGVTITDVTLYDCKQENGKTSKVSGVASTVPGIHSFTATWSTIFPGHSNTSSTSVTFSYTVTGKTSATITLSGLQQTYNGNEKPVTVTTNPAGLSYSVTYNGQSTAPTNAGIYNIVATITDPSYEGSTSGTLVISKAPATVALSNLNQVYSGTANAVIVTTVPSGLNCEVTYNDQSTIPTNVGSYNVKATINDSNYTGSITDTLIISKATAPITLDANTLNQTYDGNAKTVTATTNPSNLQYSVIYKQGDVVVTNPTNAGKYDVIATINDTNYTGFVTGTLTINKKTASVTPNADSKTYGDADPELSGSLDGFLTKDGVTATYSRTPGETVNGGPYTINATLNSTNDALSNYNINYNTAVFTINQKAASVTPKADSKIYGDADPELSGSLDGFLTKDGVTATYSRTPGETVNGGPYTIRATLNSTNDALSNYNINYNTADFTIIPRPLTVAVDPQTKVYGDDDPDLKYTITCGNLVNDDSFTGSLTRKDGNDVGSYAITQGTLALSSNYTITFVGNIFTINPAKLTVTADNMSRAYGSTNPTLTYTIAGFVNNEDSSVVSGTPDLNCDATATTPVSSSPVPITIIEGTLAAKNYTFKMVDGALTINPAVLTVKADDKSRTYGTTNPTFTYTIKGFVNGENSSVINGVPVLSCEATETTPVSTVPIKINSGTLSADNYEFAMAEGTLTINPYDFSGFFQPINMGLTVVNSVKAGSSVPVKFSLHGCKGMDILAKDENGKYYPQTLAASYWNGCFKTIVDIGVSTDTAGGSSLSYDPVSDQYTYVWKTDKSWAGYYKQLVVKFKDGTSYTANFYFK